MIASYESCFSVKTRPNQVMCRSDRQTYRIVVGCAAYVSDGRDGARLLHAAPRKKLRKCLTDSQLGGRTTLDKHGNFVLAGVHDILAGSNSDGTVAEGDTTCMQPKDAASRR
jgi:hypothetical protein